MAELISDIAALRELLAPDRRAGKTIGLVPTMGALHAGTGVCSKSRARKRTGGREHFRQPHPVQSAKTTSITTRERWTRILRYAA